ncbi:MAG: SUMF1/EgtB/PvdO family nonheme iron enzyme, partial [Planctomycetaceae bacterium]|nr:SUMF1/EgtB/PvdO family nonheme iron enzyme [Planctomycetaceae bacterium]
LWNNDPSYCRSSGRNAVDTASRTIYIGIRVVLETEAVKEALKQQKPPAPDINSSWHGWPADAPPPAIAPFNAAQAQTHQDAWAKYLGVPVEYGNSIGMKFRLIPPGEFLMGSAPEEIEAMLKRSGEQDGRRSQIESEAPQHKVILTQPVYLGATEVTQAQYEQVMGNNPSYFSAGGKGSEVVSELDTASHPVEAVLWSDAAMFCAKLS